MSPILCLYKIIFSHKTCQKLDETNDNEVAIAAHSALLKTIFEIVVTNKSQTDTWFATGEIKSCDVTFNLV